MSTSSEASQAFTLPAYEYQGEFLRYWPDRKRRGYITGLFHSQILTGQKSATGIIQGVVEVAMLKLSRHGVAEWRVLTLNRLLHQLVSSQSEAERYIAFLLDRETWPEDKKAELRNERRAFYCS